MSAVLGNLLGIKNLGLNIQLAHPLVLMLRSALGDPSAATSILNTRKILGAADANPGSAKNRLDSTSIPITLQIS